MRSGEEKKSVCDREFACGGQTEHYEIYGTFKTFRVEERERCSFCKSDITQLVRLFYIPPVDPLSLLR